MCGASSARELAARFRLHRSAVTTTELNRRSLFQCRAVRRS
jgi:hypothetical protein